MDEPYDSVLEAADTRRDGLPHEDGGVPDGDLLHRRGVLKGTAILGAASLLDHDFAHGAQVPGERSVATVAASPQDSASPAPPQAWFDGFAQRRFERDQVGTVGVVGGSGPPLLLLHGYPQTHLCWHKIAPRLAPKFTVVALDLRGYGDSDKPQTDPHHAPYSKREMALDVRHAMHTLGFDRFSVVGHDRGARVAHRLALDHPETVDRLAVLDMAPTLAMYEKTDMNSAKLWFHWFLLIQKADFPERLIGGDPGYFVRHVLGMGPAGLAPYPEETILEYIRCFQRPGTIRAICEDYRASAGIDLVHDRADRGRKLAMPILALWGAKSILPAAYDVMALWNDYGHHVEGAALDCGHFLPEEKPDEVAARLIGFLS